jgi:chromosome segregation ATPase
MTLEDERTKANDRYDDLMGRVVGILGEEYKDLRTDSNQFMDKLTTVLGEDAERSRIDQAALAEKLADIDGLREQIKTLTQEKEQQAEQIAERDSRLSSLQSEKAALAGDLAHLNEVHNRLNTAANALTTTIPHQEIGDGLGEDLYAHVLKDSKVPHAVIDGVGKFIDFKKYLRYAAARGAEEATKQSEQTLRSALDK